MRRNGLKKGRERKKGPSPLSFLSPGGKGERGCKMNRGREGEERGGGPEFFAHSPRGRREGEKGDCRPERGEISCFTTSSSEGEEKRNGYARWGGGREGGKGPVSFLFRWGKKKKKEEAEFGGWGGGEGAWGGGGGGVWGGGGGKGGKPFFLPGLRRPLKGGKKKRWPSSSSRRRKEGGSRQRKKTEKKDSHPEKKRKRAHTIRGRGKKGKKRDTSQLILMEKKKAEHQKRGEDRGKGRVFWRQKERGGGESKKREKEKKGLRRRCIRRERGRQEKEF